MGQGVGTYTEDILMTDERSRLVVTSCQLPALFYMLDSINPLCPNNQDTDDLHHQLDSRCITTKHCIGLEVSTR